jgi:hypothetical protein
MREGFMPSEVFDGSRVVGRVSEEGKRLIEERNVLKNKFSAAATEEDRVRLNAVLARDRVD